MLQALLGLSNQLVHTRYMNEHTVNQKVHTPLMSNSTQPPHDPYFHYFEDISNGREIIYVEVTDDLYPSICNGKPQLRKGTIGKAVRLDGGGASDWYAISLEPKPTWLRRDFWYLPPEQIRIISALELLARSDHLEI